MLPQRRANSSPPHWLRAVLVPTLIFLASAGLASALDPWNCTDGSPAYPVEECVDSGGEAATCGSANSIRLWSDVLRPVDPADSRLPSDRDSTAYTGYQKPKISNGLEFFSAIDIEGEYAYTSIVSGFVVWDIGCELGTTGCPRRVTYRDGWLGDFYNWGASGELYFLIWDIDAITTPSGSVLVALAADDGHIGLTVWDVTSPVNPTQLYQDYGPQGPQVHMATINNRVYAFYGTTNPPDGLHVYDLTTVEQGGACFENTIDGSHCGVHKGKIGNFNHSYYVDVLQKTGASTRTFVVHSPMNSPQGLEILEIVSAATSPPTTRLVKNEDFAGSFVRGVAMFSYAGRDYLGAVVGNQIQVYDVTTCLTSTTCTSLGELKWSAPHPNGGVYVYLTYSESNGTPFLYLGGNQRCGTAGTRREGLYNMAGLATGDPIYEVTEGDGQLIEGGGTYVDPTHGYDVDYWGDSYANNTWGYSFVSPRVGKFWGSYFFRTALTIFDIHQFGEGGAPPPPVSLTVAAPNGTQYFTEPISLFASAQNCDGTTYTWIPAASCTGFDPNVQGSDTQCTHNLNCPHPCDTPPCPEWNLEVQASKSCLGGDLAQSSPVTVNVQDGRPAIASFSVNSQPPAAEYPLCSVLNLAAAVSGKADTMTYSWALEYDNGQPVLDPTTDEPMTHDGTAWELSTEGLEPAGPEIFADGFEDGDTTRWTSRFSPDPPPEKSPFSPDPPPEKQTQDLSVVALLTVQNTVGGVGYQAEDSFAFTLTSLGELGDPTLADPVHLSPGRWEFAVTSANATEWRWEFEIDDEGTVEVYEWDDPLSQSTVEYAWVTDGTYEVRVRTRNCETRDNPKGPAAKTVVVDDAQAPPVLEIGTFTATCGGAPCVMGICSCATPSFEVTLMPDTDAPSTLEFDWTCTSAQGFTVEESVLAAADADGVYRLTHTYSGRCAEIANGLHTPQVRGQKAGYYSDPKSCTQRIDVVGAPE